MEKAQLTKDPSDITFIMTKNTYIGLGIEMKRRNIPYKMRRSQKPIKSKAYGHYGSGNRKFWSIPSNSILSEPVAMALFRITVRNKSILFYNTHALLFS